eukprot:CAMPEP_0202829000 /NCGR_PEP_ID=MMETSP1389-20130828/15248_1 /ASSEMBLY_ACC=CAM_ASM_000865 /TAXON_ID=302021 /ORGANISM="Rhodomonas sp., Strain CCMP768" /LENGTH=34 /DNA_ID= /DNA_START= /DNA_END= /DNA_ORIENTATION=
MTVTADDEGLSEESAGGRREGKTESESRASWCAT